MGYETKHTLQVIPQEDYAAVARAFVKVSDYEFLFEDKYKWYDEPEHSRIVSRRFPHAVIAITGQGDEPDDKWRAVYYGGELVEMLRPKPYEFPALMPITADWGLQDTEE